MAFSIVEPNSAGLCVTWTPAASSALILSWAPPLPPAMMAPAWPMRRPGGAVTPAMKETTGLLVLLLAFSHSAASSSALPPISPIMMIPFVAGSFMKRSRQSMKLVPLKGSPPMPTQVVWPRPACVVWCTASYVRVPDLLTMPILPGMWMYPGMMPILHSPGLMIPGQFGPMRRLLLWRIRACLTFTMSCWGMPSVMQTINGISASNASMMAAAAAGGGT
mmetsp:Transcript_70039/g.200729  ORF Transcript_70039/g.200729 Transcript_70039/m.200729 type:complete len:220 (-) Transcript_70039:376-1035(-)